MTNSFIKADVLAENKELTKLRTDNDELQAKLTKLTEENEVLKESASKEVPPPVVPAGDGSVQDKSGEKPK